MAPRGLERYGRSVEHSEGPVVRAEPLRTRVLRGAIHERLRPLSSPARELLMRAAASERNSTRSSWPSSAPRARHASSRRSGRRAGCRFSKRSTARPVLRFRHALLRDVMYGELVAAQLRPLHTDIGAALERLRHRRPNSVEELAYHWWCAADPVRGPRYNEEAGDRAGAVHANEQALLYYRRALEVAKPRSAARGRLLQKIRVLDADAAE